MSTMTEDEFRQLCKSHDLTYEYSDDGNVWRHGNETLAKVKAAAKQFDRRVAVRIWNEVVDSKLVPEARSQFYWKV
jgi:hypothetical protein